MTIEIIGSEEQKEEIVKRSEQSLRDLWAMNEQTNTHITEISEETEK